MKSPFALVLLLLIIQTTTKAQIVEDDFEGNGNISSWFGDACDINTMLSNPHQEGINLSATVLEYSDKGGQYANVRFDAGRNFDLSTNHTFSVKIYVPSSGLTGNQANQLSLKLQDGKLAEPWTTQSEIIKPILLDQWQTISFDFGSDPYKNFNSSSAAPTLRNDFNRVLLQFNGENNTDKVVAYVDDFYYFDTLALEPVFNKLVWSDEFDDNGAIDASKWFHQTQLPNGGSWYNGEIQHYTNRTANSSVSNGTLKLVAKRENFSDQGVSKQFTSARLNSKFAFTYGRVEIRAKLPTGVGTWPALWMLGKNISEKGAYWETRGFGTTPWPACGEIDIMEHWGDNQGYVSSATHTPSSFGGTVNVGGQTISTVSNQFHLYALEWSKNKLVFSVDSVVHFTYQPSVKNADTWPFDEEQYLLFNIAIQAKIAANFTESTMEVDYIRIYQEDPVGIAENSKEKEPTYFPNPFSSELNIRLVNTPNERVTAKIYQLDGKLLHTQSVHLFQNQLHLENLDHLSPGMYFLQFNTIGRNYGLKVFKE